MIYSESESIRANGFKGYIKFRNRAVVEKHLNKNIIKKYKLNDNNIEFANIGKYIDGVQKNLITTIAWFALLIS